MEFLVSAADLEFGDANLVEDFIELSLYGAIRRKYILI